MKWLLPAVGAGLLAWLLWFQINTTKVSYVNGLAPYDVVPGREYILECDAQVFNWKEHPTPGFPLLGANCAGAPTSLSVLPRGDAAAAPDGPVRLLDRIPQGTRFRIISVRREQSRRAGTVITYEAKFLDEVDRPYQKVDLRPLLLPVRHQEDVPALDPAIAVPWITR